MAKKEVKTFIKIIYFDEDSATDFIYVMEGGKSSERTENIVTKTNEISAKAEAKARASMKFLHYLDFGAGGEGGAGFTREGNSIVKKAIESTILTDYLSLSEKVKSNNYIKIFHNCRLFPYPESFAYFKMLSPFLVMTNGLIDAGDIKLDPAKMDLALELGRGYYELMALDNNEPVVLRFNIKAFRNNYSIADLVKMDLDFHTIEVGTVDASKLTMEAEFNKEKKEISGYDIMDENKAENATEYKVYDVLLSGVCK